MNIDRYLFTTYASPPCWLLVTDVYLHERSQELQAYPTQGTDIQALAQVFRLVLHEGKHGFVKVDEPLDMCLVLMGRNRRVGLHHCGIFYDKRVLHALDSGNIHQDYHSLAEEYPLMEFWAKNEN